MTASGTAPIGVSRPLTAAAHLRVRQSLARLVVSGWLSLHVRTLVTASLGMTVLLVADSAMSIRSTIHNARTALQERADLLSVTQSQALAVPLWDYDHAQVQGILKAIASDPDFEAVRLKGSDGKIIAARTASTSSAAAIGAERAVRYTDGKDERVLGTLEIHLSTARLSAEVQDAIDYEILSQLALLAAVLVTLHIALRRLAGPLAIIAQVTTRLASGDQSVTLPALDRTDEVGAVARAIQVFKENAVALARAEEKYRAIYENATLGLSRRGVGGRLIEANPALARIAGCDDEQAPLTTTLDSIRYADASRWDDLVRLLAERPIVSGFVSQIRRADGSLAWVSESARPVRDERGTLLFIDSTIEDVTERKRLAEDETLRVRAAVESASDAMAIVDGRGVPVYVNPAFRSLVGFGAAELAAVGGPTKLCTDVALGDEILVKLTRKQGWTGEIEMRSRDGRSIPVAMRASAIVGVGSAAAGATFILTDISERKQAEQQMLHMAVHDALTGLPNRVLLRERLAQSIAQAARTGGKVSVLCLDLDRFKQVNDTLGHGAGDALLKTVADRLDATVRTGDTVARLGGDEFVIVQASVDGSTSVDALCRRLVATLREPFCIAGHEVFIGASIGVAQYPVDGGEGECLLRRADLALYRAKAEGRGNHCFFDPEMDALLKARAALERDLRKAIVVGEFELHYQPQVELATQHIVGAEALLRWRHPTLGFVPPAEFIAAAEETGLIVPLGEWVIRAACQQAAAWPSPLRVAVNLSPVQFRRNDLAQTVGSILRETGLRPDRLEVEVTEGVLLRDTDATLDILRELKSLGVRIAMDDFGTGYSSLNYLRRFPFDKIKIDKSFVRDLGKTAEGAAIVKAVITLSQNLGMATNAEGVENVDQCRFLRDEGCIEFQGFLCSPALPQDDFIDFVKGFSGIEI